VTFQPTKIPFSQPNPNQFWAERFSGSQGGECGSQGGDSGSFGGESGLRGGESGWLTRIPEKKKRSQPTRAVIFMTLKFSKYDCFYDCCAQIVHRKINRAQTAHK